MDDSVLSERRGATAVLTLHRPHRANAYDAALLASLGRALEACAADGAVRAVVLAGAGRHFCAGADLDEIRGRGLGDALRLESARLFDVVAALPVPTIAAIQGAALGGGLELALACDLRLASPQATFGLPETSLGIIPAAGGTSRLPRIVGEARARELIFTARRIDAATALRFNLVNDVVEGAVLDAALAVADQIGANDPLAVRLAKRALDSGSAPHAAVAQAILYQRGAAVR